MRSIYSRVLMAVFSSLRYENMPIQIHRKFHLQKLKIFRLKTHFHISAQNIDCGYSLEPPMFLSRNNKNNVYPCKPQFYYIKVGF